MNIKKFFVILCQKVGGEYVQNAKKLPQDTLAEVSALSEFFNKFGVEFFIEFGVFGVNFKCDFI